MTFQPRLTLTLQLLLCGVPMSVVNRVRREFERKPEPTDDCATCGAPGAVLCERCGAPVCLDCLVLGTSGAAVCCADEDPIDREIELLVNSLLSRRRFVRERLYLVRRGDHLAAKRIEEPVPVSGEGVRLGSGPIPQGTREEIEDWIREQVESE